MIERSTVAIKHDENHQLLEVDTPPYADLQETTYISFLKSLYIKNSILGTEIPFKRSGATVVEIMIHILIIEYETHTTL